MDEKKIELADLIQDGLLPVRVTPKSSSNRIVVDGHPPIVRVYVTCVPEDGKANKAVIALLARDLGLPKSAFAILRGETSREKVIRVTGLPKAP